MFLTVTLQGLKEFVHRPLKAEICHLICPPECDVHKKRLGPGQQRGPLELTHAGMQDGLTAVGAGVQDEPHLRGPRVIRGARGQGTSLGDEGKTKGSRKKIRGVLWAAKWRPGHSGGARWQLLYRCWGTSPAPPSGRWGRRAGGRDGLPRKGDNSKKSTSIENRSEGILTK